MSWLYGAPARDFSDFSKSGKFFENDPRHVRMAKGGDSTAAFAVNTLRDDASIWTRLCCLTRDNGVPKQPKGGRGLRGEPRQPAKCN